MDRLKVLQIEDSVGYQLLFKKVTRNDLDITLVATIADLKNLSIQELQSVHIIILDGQLPDGTGMEVMNYLATKNVTLPIVANSSSDQYNESMLKLGAKWSFNKSQFPKEIKSIISHLQNLVHSSL